MTTSTLAPRTTQIETLFGSEFASVNMESSIDVDIVGTLFDSALLQFLLSLDIPAQKSFEMWVHEHASEPTFLSDICAHYPHFYAILQTEILNAHL